MTRAKDISKIVSDANFGGTLDVVGKITADAGVDIDNINIDGTTIALSSGDLTLDVAGDLIIDTDGAEIKLKDGGTLYGKLHNHNPGNSATSLIVESSVQDQDILLKGNDGGSVITALALDMSAGGNATFSGAVLLGSNLIVPNGNGIDFGANANASGMSSELLDDYEEGSFTPAPSSGAIANKVGKYIKVGNLVHVTMVLSNYSGASSSAVMQVGGIPFTNNGVESVGSNYVSNVNTGSSAGHVSTYVYPNNTIFRLYDQGDDVGVNALTYASFDTSSAVTVSFTYEIA